MLAFGITINEVSCQTVPTERLLIILKRSIPLPIPCTFPSFKKNLQDTQKT